MLIILSVCLGTLTCFCGRLDLLLGYVRLVGQEPAPSKCVLLSTSRDVRQDMGDWVLSQEGDKWTVKYDVRDLGGHFGYYDGLSTLAARVRLVTSRLCFDFCSSFGLSWSGSYGQVHVFTCCFS